MKNYYELLGVEQNATKSEIKKGYFKMVRKFPPDRYEKEFMEIREAYETLSNEKTKEEYDALLSIPGIAKIKFERAKELIMANYTKDAIKMLEEIEKGYPQILLPRLLLGKAYLLNGNSGKAVKLYENLVEEQPENASFRGHLASAYLYRQFNRKAIATFKKAIEIDEDNISLWIGLTDAYMVVDEPNNADKIFKKALKIGKQKGWDLSIIYYRLIMKEVTLENYNKVEEYLNKLVQLIRDNDESDINIPWKLAELGREALHLGNSGIAQSIIDKACMLLPEDENLKALKLDIEVFNNNYADMIYELAEDYRIPEEVEAIVVLKVLPKDVTDSMEDKEAIEISNKMGICMNIGKMKIGIRILKKDYPELYKVEKEFFQRVTNKNKIEKLTEEINDRAMKNPILSEMIEETMRSKGIENFFGEDDDYDDEDDDFEFNDPFGFEDRDIPEWVEPQEPFIREEKKVGRNEPCPCGSGKKYKKCCGK
ncbi:DnaJ domain-containing protein [Clostridium sp. DL1XJH146]